MPPTVKHYDTSIRRTGKDYADLHNWINDAEKSMIVMTSRRSVPSARRDRRQIRRGRRAGIH